MNGTKKQMNFLNQFKASFAEEYHLNYWVVVTFLAGGINAAVLWLYREYYIGITRYYPSSTPNEISVEAAVYLIIPTAILIVTPIVLSIILTKAQPKKHIVPPLFIQIITFGWFTLYAITKLPSQDVLSQIMLVGMFTIVGGILQDKLINWLWGHLGDKNMMLSYTIITNTTKEKLKELLLLEHSRDLLQLSPNFHDENNTTRLQTDKFEKYSVHIQLNDKFDGSNCILVMVVFRKGRYNMIRNNALEHNYHGKVDLLNGILRRNNITFNETTTPITERFMDKLIDELSGVSTHLEKIPKLSWFRISAFIAALSVTGWLLWDKGSTEGVIGILVMFLLYVAYETRGLRYKEK